MHNFSILLTLISKNDKLSNLITVVVMIFKFSKFMFNISLPVVDLPVVDYVGWEGEVGGGGAGGGGGWGLDCRVSWL